MVAPSRTRTTHKNNITMKKTDPKDFNENVFQAIGHEWMLVTSGTPDHFNMLTASWGGLGYLWNRNVAFIFIRPERYTFEFIEKNDYLTLSFLGEQHRDIYNICGTKSGRDIDKVKTTGLIPIATEKNTVTYEQARLTLVCRKLYSDDLRPERFIERECLTRWYNDRPGGGLHRMYVVEICDILKNE